MDGALRDVAAGRRRARATSRPSFASAARRAARRDRRPVGHRPRRRRRRPAALRRVAREPVRSRRARPTAGSRELNLDPRARVAAGLGAEVVRARAGGPDDRVLAAGRRRAQGQQPPLARPAVDRGVDALPRPHDRAARRPRAAARRFASDRSPMRTPLRRRATVQAAIAPTSLPDAAVDPAVRRLAAPTGRFVRKAARARRARRRRRRGAARRQARRAAPCDVDPTVRARRASRRPPARDPTRGRPAGCSTSLRSGCPCSGPPPRSPR